MSNRLAKLNFVLLVVILHLILFPASLRIYYAFSGRGPDNEMNEKYEALREKYGEMIQLQHQSLLLKIDCTGDSAACDRDEIDNIEIQIEVLSYEIEDIRVEIDHLRWANRYTYTP